ncbi:hypothetical protein SAY86_017440 [Trapa natans]|uniref:Uncharacterized protein n=1 Tax=Trapa natans TaxID=22666 RepID=A0AAN7LPA9_TRANT|nr:hypothetical protein SAY86_017440 [Trapa natans]
MIPIGCTVGSYICSIAVLDLCISWSVVIEHWRPGGSSLICFFLRPCESLCLSQNPKQTSSAIFLCRVSIWYVGISANLDILCKKRKKILALLILFYFSAL